MHASHHPTAWSARRCPYALAGTAAFLAALARARDVTLGAYTLGPGPVEDALAAAARRGARVTVRLERDPFDGPGGALHARNAAAVALLRAAGADAAPSEAGSPPLHLKAAVVDGRAWLDGRNWAARGDLLVRDADPADVRAVAAVLRGGVAGKAGLALAKAEALRAEAAAVRAAGPGPLGVASESFGDGPLARALAARARSGATVRLVVAAREALAPGPRGVRERGVLARLERAGVAVRLGGGDAKLAAGGAAAWIGSANATWAGTTYGAQRDWGLATRAPALVRGLRAAFAQVWRTARPWPP